MAAVINEEGQPKLQGGQDGLKYKMYSAGPALKIDSEVRIDGVRVNCGKFKGPEYPDGYPGSHLEMVPLPKQVLNMVMRKWRADNPDDFNTYMNNPIEESALFNDSDSLKKVWSEVAQTAFGPKSSRLWLGGPDQCKMAGAGMYGWRVARLRNLPRPHKAQEEKEEEEEEGAEGGGDEALEIARQNGEIEALKNAINELEESNAYMTEQYNEALSSNARMESERNDLSKLIRELEVGPEVEVGKHFYTENVYGKIVKLSRWINHDISVAYTDVDGVETFTFKFTPRAAGAAAGVAPGAPAAAAAAPAPAAAVPGAPAPAPGAPAPAAAVPGAPAPAPGAVPGVAPGAPAPAAAVPGGAAAAAAPLINFNGGIKMKVENQKQIIFENASDKLNERLQGKYTVDGEVDEELKAKYNDLLDKTAKNDVERKIQSAALAQGAVILPWSVITKIVKKGRGGMTENTFYNACKTSSEADKKNRVIAKNGADLLLNYVDQGDGGWDIYGVLSMDQDILTKVINFLKDQVIENVSVNNVLAFIICASAESMTQTLVLNDNLPNLEPWKSVGAVVEKNNIYEVDTVCSKSGGGKKSLGQLLMLWALAKKLDSGYSGTALKVVKIAIPTKKDGETYHGPPDIGVANLYHNVFKYQRAFPFPRIDGTVEDKRWHKRWTDEIPGSDKDLNVGIAYWTKVDSYFDPTKPPPYKTIGYTYGAQDLNVVTDPQSTYNREEYWMYRPYPTVEQLETITEYVISEIVKPAAAAAAPAARPSRRASAPAK